MVAPTDAQQGEVYRIIYYHVPSAWTAFLLFFINFLASIQYLVNGKPAAEKAAKWIVIGIARAWSDRCVSAAGAGAIEIVQTCSRARWRRR